ncbi:hypothetical protein Bca52824_013912 [Brassica carinata]|uniref:Trichome birefringence-like N-terminal domain-containing protein n=1 Tax=Brassica carinata TaxID=52824 RepID=A0A8X7VZ70_BRACI|nr:hypothetical protein Bca52824_013912 [Brassica carinata]
MVTILLGLEQALASDNTLLENTNHRNSTADGGMSSLRGKKQRSGCNLFQGRWVFDASYPFYDSLSCPFIDGEFDCLKFGRPDKQFLKYSWQPESCTIPSLKWQQAVINYSKIRRCGVSEEIEREASHVRGRLTEFEHVGIVGLYDTCVSTKTKTTFVKEPHSLLSLSRSLSFLK